MSAERFRRFSGMTLVEIMIAITVISVAVLGAGRYRYYTALDAHKTDVQMTAARVALMLCESWRGVKGSVSYDPTSHLGDELVITSDTGPDAPDDFTALGSYSALLNGFKCYTTLSWKDIDTGLRALNVEVAWPQKGYDSDSFSDADKTLQLTVYTLN